MSTPATIPVTVNIPVTDLTAEAIEEAVINRCVAKVLGTDSEGYDEDGELYRKYDDALIKRMRAATENLIVERIGVVVEKNGDTFVADVLNGQFQPMNEWGEKKGAPTSIREMVYKHARAWLDMGVKPDGSAVDRYYSGPQIRRLHWLVSSEVAAAFKGEIGEQVKAVAAEIKPAIAKQFTAAVAETVNRLLGVSK